MEPFSSHSRVPQNESFSLEQKLILLNLASGSIQNGLQYGAALEVDPSGYPDRFRRNGACFVTLKIRGRLRGCIGTLEGTRPLVVDLAENAYKAAFSDPRFPALTLDEFRFLEMDISILSPPEPILFSSEADLVQKVRPGIDGLILEDGMRRGTFLPSLWDTLSDPWEFVRELKRKAGFDPDYWSDTLKVQRYTTETIDGDSLTRRQD